MLARSRSSASCRLSAALTLILYELQAAKPCARATCGWRGDERLGIGDWGLGIGMGGGGWDGVGPQVVSYRAEKFGVFAVRVDDCLHRHDQRSFFAPRSIPFSIMTYPCGPHATASHQPHRVRAVVARLLTHTDGHMHVRVHMHAHPSLSPDRPLCETWDSYAKQNRCVPRAFVLWNSCV